jgi:hypothetical protein
MPIPSNAVDTEIPSPTREELTPGGRPSWWRRATAYGLNRLADALEGRRRTPAGTGRALAREARNLRLNRTT